MYYREKRYKGKSVRQWVKEVERCREVYNELLEFLKLHKQDELLYKWHHRKVDLFNEAISKFYIEPLKEELAKPNPIFIKFRRGK